MTESKSIDEFDSGKLEACVIFIYLSKLIDDPEFQKEMKETFYPVLPMNSREKRIDLINRIMILQIRIELESRSLYEKMKSNEEVRKNLENICKNVGVYTLEV